MKSALNIKNGQIELIDEPSKPVASFTQKDINDKRIVFACIECSVSSTSNNNLSEVILFNVTDGKSAFQMLALKIFLYDLEIKIKQNKGIFAVHNSTSLIQSKDLQFGSNIADEFLLSHIRIDVVEQPVFGVLECKRENKFWIVCDWFFTGDILQKHVRYRHTTGTPDFDEFKFRASVNKIHTSMVHNFTITFIKLKLEQLHLNSVTLNGTSKSMITIDHIQYQTIPILASNKNIKYVITKLPKYGDIISNQNENKLQNGDSFTQFDIEKEYLSYKLHMQTYSKLNDSIQFIVSSKNCENTFGTLNIVYIPSENLKQQSQVKLQALQVIEGEKVNIGVTYLSVQIQSISKLMYNISEGPFHGNVQRCKSCTEKVKCKSNCENITVFSNDDLSDGIVFYSHDNSETRYDHFEFIVRALNFQYIGVFNVNVILKNDNPPRRVIDKILQVVIDQTKLITGQDLKYDDADINTTPHDIIYTCQMISNGILFNIGSEPHEKVTTFTQADLDNRQILFKHHGDEYGKIQLWITDGQFYENGILEVYASKPFIKIISNEIIVKQFKSVVIDQKLLNIETNLNAIGKHIIYRVLKSPKYGYLKFSVNYDSVRFFSQDDLNAGHVIYVHNKTDYDSITDYFSVRVTCEGTYSEDKIKIKILPTVYWEPMIILSTNESLFVEESTSVVVPKTHLEVLHPDIPAEEIIYYIKSKPKNGYLQIINEPNSHNSIKTFDQRIINLGQLEYIQNVANKTEDQIIFNVTNGIIWLYNVLLNIQIIPEHFYLRTYHMNVTEGGTVIISKDDIQIITTYYKSKVSYYTITRLPNYGVIQIADSREHLRKFSERDLIKGLVKYVHDNSENFEDFFEIVAHAGTKESEVANIKINITPINDQVPVLVNNTGLQMWEGACEQITSTHLGAIDGDIPHDTIIFRVSGNWWGNIVLKSNSTPLTSFTQQQIEDGLIYFNHTNGTIAKFLFRLTDNIHTSKEYIFTIETKPVDLKLITNQGIHVFPFNRQVIGTNHLKAEASDPERDIIYKVIIAPMLGRIVVQINNGHLYSTDNFSQKDLDSNRIFYEHTHPFDGLYANDSFSFNIEGHLLPKIINEKFNIDISVSSGDLNTYIPITPITVDEGGSAPILLNITEVIHFLETHANLHAPIIHATVWQPDHGTVYVNDNTNITTFTQSQLESNVVKYQHDHSDTLNDTIHFTLYLLPDYITLCTVNIPVHVNPINDQPFKLITQAPHMNVVYGENVTITKDLLLTEDPDTPPEHLEYGIINGLTEGKIVLAPDYMMPINTFTQKDINDGKVVYKHSGSNTTVSFHFRVWDGKFKPIYTIFNIRVIPVSISLNLLSPIYIQQGLNVASFTPQHIQIRTNVNENRIIYNVTHAPYFGTIYVQDTPKLSFTHDDLINARVMYMQTNMTSPNDTFIILASCLHNAAVSNSISAQMLVQPLMQRGNFTAIIGTQNKITLNILDATPLAELTGSNPQYRIVRKPTFGELHKIIRSSGERKIVYDQQVDTFNHEEIRIGVIYYVLPGDESLNDIEDLLKFLLIGNVFYQPAYGDLKIRILSDRVEPELKRHRGGMHLASPNISSDYLPIVIMVAGVLFLGVSVIIIIKCRSIDVSKQNARNNTINNQPIPLPRPPDHLMASTSNLKPFIEEIPLTTHHTSLPHCKVTPLGPTDSSLASSDLDIRSRYPYGSADDGTIIEDWCSQDAPSDSIIPHPQPLINAANPLLRRNQYWV